MDKRNDEDRANVVKETGGAPIVDYDGRSNPNIDYQLFDLLHSLQHLRSEKKMKCFYIMGQTKELLFRGLHMEPVNARASFQSYGRLGTVFRSGQFKGS